MIKTVVLVSGGLDSATCLYHELEQTPDVAALSVLYGQRHKIELLQAVAICQGLGVQHRVIDLSVLSQVMTGSSQTSSDIPVPLGHYEEETMKTTVVPNRNMVLLSVAAAWAISLGAGKVSYAAHAGDHAIYPDCRPEFAEAMKTVLSLCDWKPVQLDAPFINLTKTQIVKRAIQLGVPLSSTYSCYEGILPQCGRCSTCYERRLAFYEAGVQDCTPYQYPMPNYVKP